VKSFLEFITEAVKTNASTQAKQKGLTGDGHGGWYDKSGKFVAKTVDGKLKFTGSKETGKDDAPKQGGPSKPNVPGKTATPTAASPAPTAQSSQTTDKEDSKKKAGSPEEQSLETMGEPSSGSAVIVFGRFNPPTIGHEKLLNAASSEAKRSKADLRIYPSRTQDAKKNPLEPGTKIEYMRMMFPDFEEEIRDDPEAKTIFNVLQSCYGLGYRGVTIMVGQDRLAEFQSLAQKYNGDLYEFDEIKVISAGTRDADSDGVEGMSASKMRKAAKDGDFKAFAKGIPNSLGNVDKKQLFNTLQKSMGASVSEDWEVAPKLDPEGLRIAYMDNEVFTVGSLVENLNTGELGRITRRGTNHVICMTPEGTIFKSWLRDIMEAYEVGTDEYREYAQSMTPGQGKKKFGFPKGRINPTVLPLKPNDPPSGPGTKYNK